MTPALIFPRSTKQVDWSFSPKCEASSFPICFFFVLRAVLSGKSNSFLVSCDFFVDVCSNSSFLTPCCLSNFTTNFTICRLLSSKKNSVLKQKSCFQFGSNFLGQDSQMIKSMKVVWLIVIMRWICLQLATGPFTMVIVVR